MLAITGGKVKQSKTEDKKDVREKTGTATRVVTAVTTQKDEGRNWL